MDEKILESRENMEQERSPLELNERELDAVHSVSAKIDLSDPLRAQQYGASVQGALAQFTASCVGSARGRELGETAENMVELRAALKAFRAEETGKGFFFALFSKQADRRELLRNRYLTLLTSVESTAEELEGVQLQLAKDLEQISQLEQKCVDFFKMVTIYVLAGKRRLRRERETTLANMREIARRTGVSGDAQAVKDYEESCRLFEVRLGDLEQTREICLSIMPQLSLLRETVEDLSVKLSACFVDAVSNWKERIVHDLRLGNAPAEANQETVDRGRPDGDAAKYTCSMLVKAMDELLRNHAVSMQNYASAETELRRIDSQMQQKVLELI